MPDDFQRGIEALLHHSIIDALFEAQLRGPIPYTDEGYAVMIKAVEKAVDELGVEHMQELQRRWIEFVLSDVGTPGCSDDGIV